MPHSLSAVDKFNRYVTMHPKECKGKSAYEICTSILNMSQKELQEIENNHFLIPLQYSSKQAPAPYAGFKSPVEKMVHKPQKAKQPVKSTGKKYHPQATFAEVDDKGKIKPQQFSIEAIKQKYNSKNYKVTQNPKTGAIDVKNKKGDLVLKVKNTSNKSMYLVLYAKDANTHDKLMFDRTGQVRRFQHGTKDSNGNMTFVTYDNGSKKPSSVQYGIK